MRAAAYLVYAGDYLQRPEEVVAKAFGESYASLVSHTRKLVQIQRAAREAQVETQRRAQQTERVRKMLLAFSRDLRVVLLRLASRLQTLRWYAASKHACPEALARESLQVFAPLANRLGIWQIKWELEDLAFRFLQPRRVPARGRAARREARWSARQRSSRRAGSWPTSWRPRACTAEVQGRPKHLYSIWKKMQGKGLDFARVFDVRALRVIVDDVPACYAALARVHEPVRAAARRVRRLHRPAQAQRLPVAAHRGARPRRRGRWRCRSARARCTSMPSTAWPRTGPTRKPARAAMPASAPAATSRSAWPRRARRCCASCWPGSARSSRARRRAGRRRHVRRPHLRLHAAGRGDRAAGRRHAGRLCLQRCTPTSATAAAARASTARMVPLNTPLHNGQTVEIIAAKEGGPSLRLAQCRARLS